MKRDRIKTLLLAEALICALLALALWLFEGDAFSVAGFPGSAVGQGLSALAASGRFGFALAFTLYAAVILLPLYALVHIAARRELKPEDALLVLIAFAAACALFPHGWTAYWSTSAEALFPRLAWQWLIFALLAGWGCCAGFPTAARRSFCASSARCLPLPQRTLSLKSASQNLRACFLPSIRSKRATPPLRTTRSCHRRLT